MRPNEMALRRCPICGQYDIRVTKARLYRLIRYEVENGVGKRETRYAHAACLKKQYGQLWTLLCSDPAELKALEGYVQTKKKPARRGRPEHCYSR